MRLSSVHLVSCGSTSYFRNCLHELLKFKYTSTRVAISVSLRKLREILQIDGISQQSVPVPVLRPYVMQEASSQVEDVDTEIAEAQGSAANDTAAALVASLLTSVIEAPVELFRHRMQVISLEDKANPEHLACIYLKILRPSL